MSDQSSLGQAGSKRAVRLVDLREARSLTLRNLGFSVEINDLDHIGSLTLSPMTDLTVHAEALRATLWSLSRRGSTPVYITRLLRAMSRLIDSGVLAVRNEEVSDTATEYADSDSRTERPLNEQLRDVLHEMEILGDVASLPGGYWLPAPLRIIPMSPIRRWVIVGGIPTNQFPPHVGEMLEHMGTARILSRPPSEVNLPLPQQSEEDWCRLPHSPIDVWTQDILFSPSPQPYEEAEECFEYYAPGIAKRREARELQFFRWVETANSLPDGRYLARRKSMIGPNLYTIAEVRRGSVVATCVLDSETVDIRRLQYGLDLLAGLPVTVDVTRTEGGWSFQLKNELPRSEHRIFMMLGRLRLLPNKQYYPRWWELPAGYAAQAVSALERLHVRLNSADGLLKQLAD